MHYFIYCIIFSKTFQYIFVFIRQHLFEFTVLWRSICRLVMNGRAAGHRYLQEKKKTLYDQFNDYFVIANIM